MHKKVTAHNFADSTDDEIIEAARQIIRNMPEGPARKRAGRKVLSRKPDVMKAGKFLWRYLTSPKATSPQ